MFANEEEDKFASAFRVCLMLAAVLYAASHHVVHVSVTLQKSHIAFKQRDQKYDSFCYSTCCLGFTTWNLWTRTFRLRIHCHTSR
jgi:hypothetical protein